MIDAMTVNVSYANIPSIALVLTLCIVGFVWPNPSMLFFCILYFHSYLGLFRDGKHDMHVN